MSTLFDLFSGPLLWLGQLSFLIQIGLCIHVYRTGRPFWWIGILIIAPVIGGLAYAFLELLPDARSTGRHSINFSWFIPRSIVINRLREELEESETIERRLTLASLLFESGRKEEADELATPAVSGVFKDDATVISEVAWYKLELGKAAEAQQLLAKADTKAQKALLPRIELLRARVRFCNGDYAGAKATFDALHNSALGEEPRYFSAECLRQQGLSAEATELYRDIVKKYRKGTPVWRRAEKVWFKAAKLRLNTPHSPAPADSTKAP